MKHSRPLLIALLAVTLPLGVFAAPPSVIDQSLVCTKNCPGFYDAYKKDKDFRNGLLNAIKAAGIRKPDWISNGVATPFEKVNVGGAMLLSTFVCEPHNCGNNKFFILVEPRTKVVMGMYVEDMRRKTYFGNPDGTQKKALDELDK